MISLILFLYIDYPIVLRLLQGGKKNPFRLYWLQNCTIVIISIVQWGNFLNRGPQSTCVLCLDVCDSKGKHFYSSTPHTLNLFAIQYNGKKIKKKINSKMRLFENDQLKQPMHFADASLLL